jgi:hypothetical protein
MMMMIEFIIINQTASSFIVIFITFLHDLVSVTIIVAVAITPDVATSVICNTVKNARKYLHFQGKNKKSSHLLT